MKIIFRDKKLAKSTKDYRKCCRLMGEKRSKFLALRLNTLRDAATLEEVRNMPGRFHELMGDRKGQWACDLDHPYRLLFRPLETPIPVNKDGQYIWVQILGVEITEIVDYH